MAYRVHLASAIVCAVCAMGLVACNRPLLLLLWLPWVGVFVWKTKGVSTWPTQTFWAEMMCFAITFIYAYLMASLTSKPKEMRPISVTANRAFLWHKTHSPSKATKSR